MRTRKEVTLKDCLNQLSNLQENLITNRAFPIAERISIVDYLDTVKTELKNKIIKNEVISNEIAND